MRHLPLSHRGRGELSQGCPISNLIQLNQRSGGDIKNLVAKGMSGQTIISIISTNLGPFGANLGITVGQSSSIRWYPSIFRNRIVFLEIRDLENLLFSTAYLKLRIYSVLSTASFRSTQWLSGQERTRKGNSDTTDRND